jgi:diketogulonate reductase-like aldo/keto reductase
MSRSEPDWHFSLDMTKDLNSDQENLTRREAARLLVAATAAGLLLPVNTASAQEKRESKLAILMRPISSSGDKVPVIGLGTWQVFDVGSSDLERKPLGDVLSLFVKLGGRVIDSSPMYGPAEEVIGDLATKLALRDSLFLATKVWTTGKQSGIESMERSLARLQTKRIDLMQVHNLVDVGTHLATLRDSKAQGHIRYLGVTHYNSRAYDEVEKVLRNEKLDFVQINYSIMEREAEQRLLPLAQKRGVAVIVNRPFGGGDLFRKVRAKELPQWTAEFDCHSWAQFFLKWIITHPAVTCVIPATSNVRHLEDNMHAGLGRLPTAKERQKMVELVSAF